MATSRPGLTAELPSASPRGGGSSIIQLADEAVEFSFQNTLAATPEQWTPLAEVQARHLLTRARLQMLLPSLTMLRGQIAAEREIPEPKPEQSPLHAGFIDLPVKLLDNHRRKGEASELGRVMALAGRLRDEVDRVIVLGAGGGNLGPRALFNALLPVQHNELPPAARLGRPRLYFEGHSFDADAFQELLDMLENNCIDPELRDERWGVIAIGRDGGDLETSTALRLLRAEAGRFYGSHSPLLSRVFVPVASPKSVLRDLFKADGYPDEDILTVPDNVGNRYCVFSPVGLLPAALMGLDVRALLLGAVAMTKRFFEEPFERNPVLQYAAVNYLATEELHKTVRVTALWSQKLEGLGQWYDFLVGESLGKQGRGPTPLCAVMPRDLHSRGQLLQDGPRDKMVNHLVVRTPRTQPLAVGMADRNEDGLNSISRKTYADLQNSALQAASQAQREVGRPSAELVLPALSEHVLGQVIQMLMLATVVEGRLMGINPYGEPGLRPYKSNLKSILGLS